MTYKLCRVGRYNTQWRD